MVLVCIICFVVPPGLVEDLVVRTEVYVVDLVVLAVVTTETHVKVLVVVVVVIICPGYGGLQTLQGR